MYGQPPPQFIFLTGQPPLLSYLNHPTYLHNLYYNHHHHPPNPTFNNLTTQSSFSSGDDQNVMEHSMFIMKIGKAVNEARRCLVSQGKYVSSAKVVENVVVGLNVDEWDSLGVEMKDVPPLFRLMQLEKKVV